MRYTSDLSKSDDGYYGCGDEWYDRDIDNVLGYTFIESGRKERVCNGCDKVINSGQSYVGIYAIEETYDTVAKQGLGEKPLRLTFHTMCAYAQYVRTWIEQRIEADILRVNTKRFRQQQALVHDLLPVDWLESEIDQTCEEVPKLHPLADEIDFLFRLAECVDPDTKWSIYRTSTAAWNVGISRALALQTC